MAAANNTAAKKPLAEDACIELLAFLEVTKHNDEALAAWNEHVQHTRPVIEVIDIRGTPERFEGTFILAANLSRFIGTEVTA